MPAAKKPAAKKKVDVQSARSDSIRANEDAYYKQVNAAYNVPANKVSKRFQQSMDSTAKAGNAMRDRYAVEMTRRDSVSAVNKMKDVRKRGANAIGGELTHLPVSKKASSKKK
jgi:hypothetical protein